MTRRVWRYLIGTMLTLALAGLFVALQREGTTPDILSPSFLATKALPELLQRIRNFHRVITREGRTVLEVSASEASYFKNDKAIEILNPKVVFYEEGERVGEVSASKGRLYLDGTEVQRVEVSEGVLFEIGRLRVTTENLSYDRASNKIHAPNQARVEAAEMTLTGADMTVDMLERSVVIASAVNMSLLPKPQVAP